MPREFQRAQRVAQAIHRALAAALSGHEADELRRVTVTHVDVSRDLGVAKVFVTVLTDELRGAALETLRASSGALRKAVAGQVRLRSVPELRFVFDESIARGDRVSALIERARRRDQAPAAWSDDSDD